ncbi:6863_t:CDS:2 [Funneliformis geosporum]|uniref:6863_t:CDS:1 n=1 Tax=Funneliformis geosporum TaxID=1117311 RepID=A0A9W4T4P9_9GLOM|nr:6863_t:CDS:2 [Funneliformis geosporum]
MARALVEKASKLQMPDNSHIRASYTSTVEAGISFKKTNHFDAVIGITNVTTPVNVKAFIQIMFRIHDCYENIHAELKSAQPNNLSTAIRRHH